MALGPWLAWLSINKKNMESWWVCLIGHCVTGDVSLSVAPVTALYVGALMPKYYIKLNKSNLQMQLSHSGGSFKSGADTNIRNAS